ncbi:hypothetical protein [Sphingomonas sp.]|uniref:hypothetical protein n=1 Tax=Sphingomonas sp. TaxID=28214 RepID=UPI002608F88E|nr:hypothetical protein [Sphingomonas sp.]MDF2493700.1 hypothetical protein [Sphingomonas sp.]
MSALEVEERLYLGPAAARLAAERRKAEQREDDGDDDLEPIGPLVVLIADGDAFAVLIDPPLPCGDHRRSCATKQDAWHEARELWGRFKLGFSDRTRLSFGRIGPNRERPEL